jgi:protein phosphatase 1 regulatory subunit 7
MKIEGLDALTNLELLDLSYNNIKKIENISHLKKLKKLYLLSNKIKKVSLTLNRYKILTFLS